MGIGSDILIKLPANYNRKKFWEFADKELSLIFLDDSIEMKERFTLLFRYMITGFFHYLSADSAHVYYPGAPSYHGRKMDGIEGFTRVLPLISMWISSGRDEEISLLDGMAVSLADVVRRALLYGTDPVSPNYWGHIEDFDQRICEASDVALSVWMLRNTIWNGFSRREKERITSWLSLANGKSVPDNNWHVMPVTVNKVLQSLGYEYDAHVIETNYSRLKEFYRGGGWFSDGPADMFDFYNAWGFHYPLFWLDRIDPKFDKEFISISLEEFVDIYKHFISPQGIPILGRSIGIRMAAPSPIIASALKSSKKISFGLARRSLDCTWKYFISKGSLERGAITQGYWKKDLRFVENYCGPATPLWALRSLILAFSVPFDSQLWVTKEEPLPVEVADFTFDIPAPGWIIKGFKKTGEIRLIRKNTDSREFKINKYTLFHKTAEIIRGKPYRPNNHHIQYGLKEYSSKKPFFIEYM